MLTDLNVPMRYFQNGEYKTAEGLYGQAIQKDPDNAKLFTNRAICRIRLQSWQNCMDDCMRAIAIDDSSMKAWYYLAQAQISLHHPNEALSSAIRAYEICIQTFDSSAGPVSQLILRAKKEKWEAKEKERIRRRSELLDELEKGLTRMGEYESSNIKLSLRNGEISKSEAEEREAEVVAMTRSKIEEVHSSFAISDPEHLAKREVPDWMIDNITFSVMYDPVITRNGHSYERATLLEHLKHSPTDPLTREPLTIQDLRPNLALKEACAEFLEKNGWAVDY